MQYKIIDAHTHIFPEKIEQKAVASIGDFYGLTMHNCGLSQKLIESGSKIGVSKYLVCSTATVSGQVRAINDFIHEQALLHSEFVPFGTMHPLFDDIENELIRIKQFGFKGIKIHPDFQKFDIDADYALKMYELIEKHGFALLVHTGDERYDYSRPYKMNKIAGMYRNMVCIASHFGGYSRWDEVKSLDWNDNVYFDTSSSLFKLERSKALGLIDKIGYKKFFFGTDYPMWEHEKELERFLSLGLDEKTNQAILYDNFAEMFLK